MSKYYDWSEHKHKLVRIPGTMSDIINGFDYDKFDSMYTDETGDKHPCYWEDTMPGKGGYVGIVYLDHGKTVHAFVELDAVEVIS